MPAGRPSSYSDEFAAQAEKLAKLGATDMEIADFFQVSVRTLHRWKGDYPEFCHSLKAGKEVADERVERSLFQRAIGFEHEAVKILQDKGKPVIVPYREYVVPDTTACIFWLKNRKSQEWRDTRENKYSGRMTLEQLVCGDSDDDDSTN
jgi:hypothetical protein